MCKRTNAFRDTAKTEFNLDKGGLVTFEGNVRNAAACCNRRFVDYAQDYLETAISVAATVERGVLLRGDINALRE